MKTMPKKDHQRGASLVEFALVLPILLVLIFGIIEFGVLLYDKAVITNASREGARYGIVYAYPARLNTTQINQIALNYCQNNLISLGGASTPAITSSSCAGTGSPITVSVTYDYNFLVLPNFIQSLSGPINLRADTTMRCE
jgi:Flp pilus assembly protein TadG